MIVTKVSAHALTLEWRPPIDDGGFGLLGYIVEMSYSAGLWSRVGYTSSRETNYTVAGLREGEIYFFRVSAENPNGYSRPLQSDCIVPSKPLSKFT